MPRRQARKRLDKLGKVYRLVRHGDGSGELTNEAGDRTRVRF
jgi:hypothetical protein